MKKLITFCFLLLTGFAVSAQQKPTKKETIAYLDKVLKLSVGYNRYAGVNPRYSERTITDYEFSSEKIDIHFKETKIKDSRESLLSQTYSKIAWETLKEIVEDTLDADLHDAELITVVAYFDTKLKYDATAGGNEVIMDAKDHYPKYILFNILKIKAAVFKKALERLVEIAKEENKDLFAN